MEELRDTIHERTEDCNLEPPGVAPLTDNESGTDTSDDDMSLLDQLDDETNIDEIRKLVLKHSAARIAQYSSSTTQKQYGVLHKEYQDWSKAVHNGCTKINAARALLFLTWQAHRPKRSKALEAADNVEEDEDDTDGDTPEEACGSTTGPPKYRFRIRDYKKVMDFIKTVDVNEPESFEYPIISRSAWEKYRSALLDRCETAADRIDIKNDPAILQLNKQVVNRWKKCVR
jgi:hypothetical protein